MVSDLHEEQNIPFVTPGSLKQGTAFPQKHFLLATSIIPGSLHKAQWVGLVFVVVVVVVVVSF
jgi:hypothetical protein